MYVCITSVTRQGHGERKLKFCDIVISRIKTDTYMPLFLLSIICLFLVQLILHFTKAEYLVILGNPPRKKIFRTYFDHKNITKQCILVMRKTSLSTSSFV